MTGSPTFVPYGSGARVPRSRRQARARTSGIRKCALVTGAAVAAGFGLAMTALPPLETPGRVAQVFVQSQFDHDWATSWALLCEATRAATDFTTYAEQSAYLTDYYVMPSDGGIEVEGVRAARGPDGPYLTVTLTITAAERDGEVSQTSGEMRLVEEGGELRVWLESASAGL
jgi:hypothetical protein